MDIRVRKLARIPALPTPREGFRALMQRAPYAQEAVHRFAQRLVPAWIVLYQVRRRIATGAVLVLTVWLFIHVMFGANGMVVYKQKRIEIHDLEKQVHALELENQRYGEQIKNLKSDPSTIEKEAREALHYARPGEVVYVAPPPVTTAKPATNSAKK
jgi:cell division protein FtsB